MTLAVGDLAPDFTLPDVDYNDVTLSSFRGQGPVTLVFIPFAFSGICEAELCELRDHQDLFANAGATVIAVSCDRSQTNKAWTEQHQFGFTMLSDGWPHGRVASLYGCFNEVAGCAERMTVVVDTDGKISSIFRSGGIGDPRQFSEYQAALGG